jgi:ATP-dependent DNA helicase RecG
LINQSLHKLHKLLKLEVTQGCENRAVIGGLDRMLDHWAPEARHNSLPEPAIQAVVACLHSYAALGPAERYAALGELWQRLQAEAGAELPPLPPYPTEKPTPRPTAAPTARPVPKAPSEPSEPPAWVEPTGPDSAAPTPSPEIAPHRPSPAPAASSAALNASVTVLPGVGPRHGQTLGRLGLHTLGDMLYYFPRRYDDYSQLKPINRLWYGDEVTVVGLVQSLSSRKIRGGKQEIVEALISDGSGTLRVTWFNPWVAKRIRPGMHVTLSGKVEQRLGRLAMSNPDFEAVETQNLHTNRIVPIYPLTGSLSQRWLRSLMHQVITHWAPRVQDPLPDALRRAAGVMPLPIALLQAHFPDSAEQLTAARHRLAFDEIFLLQLGVLRQKRAWQGRQARIFETPPNWLSEQVQRLPFTLTQAQQRALEALRTDLASGRPMNRLLQGDVGSGKTVIAALGILMVTNHGAQAALMAPTSILAEQHYRSLLSLLTAAGGPLTAEQICLLVGATPEAEKDQIRERLASGDIKLVIGTHALLEDPITFADLELTIIDEQHRFGVEQRALLRSKGKNPHLLVMTATPIPRSLALTLYGDLDLTVMDELPPGRQVVNTQVFYPRERERAYALVRSQIAAGHQAFIIYPLVEESENSDRAAVEEHARLQADVFPDLKLGLLHGRLKPEEKETVMRRFRDWETQVLVTTSVVEVGVDVPNATVMVVEGANRFGLAQLHQFRGRVGRGQDKAYCVLIPEKPDEAENQRLSAMVETNDGFVLAERDLQQRGPGDFLGTRQAGFAELRMATLTDVRLIEKARTQAQNLFQQDPNLALPEHQPLSAALQRFWQTGQGDIS